MIALNVKRNLKLLAKKLFKCIKEVKKLFFLILINLSNKNLIYLETIISLRIIVFRENILKIANLNCLASE